MVRPVVCASVFRSLASGFWFLENHRFISLIWLCLNEVLSLLDLPELLLLLPLLAVVTAVVVLLFELFARLKWLLLLAFGVPLFWLLFPLEKLLFVGELAIATLILLRLLCCCSSRKLAFGVHLALSSPANCLTLSLSEGGELAAECSSTPSANAGCGSTSACWWW